MEQQEQYKELEPMVEVSAAPVFCKDRFDKSVLRPTADGYKEFRLYANDYPTVYILHESDHKKPEAYVGETSHFRKRMKSHLKNARRKRLKQVVAIGCETFNKSATYNIESNLISCLLADGKYVLQNESQTSPEFTMHDYYQKAYYDGELFQEIWNQLIHLKVACNALDEIENRDVFKLSPYKQLSASQNELVREAIDFCEAHINDSAKAVFLIKGDAGTGKSVVLSTLFKALSDRSQDPVSPLHKTKNVFLVNHSEQLKTYKEIARRVEGLLVKQFMKPTTFINQVEKGAVQADIAIVDEAHLLLSHSDPYNNYEGDNHLKDIIQHSKVTIVVYDDKQVLKLKSYWNEGSLQRALPQGCSQKNYELTEQFRMHASQGVVDWIDTLVDKRRVLALPDVLSESQERPFELRMFDNLCDMYEAIQEKDAQESLSRLIATFDYEHKKTNDGTIYYVEEGSLKLPWNVVEDDSTWAERSETVHEVGSIYTVQGFDLNYAGVILGPSVTYDRATKRIKIVPEKYRDTEAFKGREDIPSKDVPRIKERIILNSVNILLKRAVKGLYIYASDEALRERLIELQEERLERVWE